jgi:hypothetical protein
MVSINRRGIAAALFLIVATSIFISGCSQSAVPEEKRTDGEGEGFAIYLTKDNIPPSQMAMLSHVEIVDEPVIGIDDIVSYNAVTHEIELTQDGFSKVTGQAIPTSGTSFLVCIDKSPVYWGAFWVSYSSLSFDGIVIEKPFSGENSVITIKPGYPSLSSYSGKDPRDNIDIMKSLNNAGKLVNEQPTTFIDELPRAFKGWELYSWQDEGEWQFRLILGTNRTKTPEEILGDETTIDDLTSIRITGVDALLSVLSKLPEGEEVIWFDAGILTADSESGREIFTVGKDMIKTVRRYAENRGLVLTTSVQ